MATGNRTLKLSILADVDDLKKKLGEADKAVESNASKMSEFGKKAAAAFAIAAAAAAAYAIKIGVDGVKAAIEDEAAQLKLASALRTATGATDAQIKATEDYITKTALAVGIADDELRPAFQRLAIATGSTTKSQQLLNLAVDISKGSGKDLTSVVEALSKSFGGQDTQLVRLGIGLTAAQAKTMDFKSQTELLSDLYGGAASRNAETFQGRIDRLKVGFDEAKESIGAALLPIIEKLIEYVFKYGVPIVDKFKAAWEVVQKAIDDNKQSFDEFVQLLQDYVLPVLGKVFGFLVEVGGEAAATIINIFGKIAAAITPVLNFIIDAINLVIRGLNLVNPGNNIPYLNKIGASGADGFRAGERGDIVTTTSTGSLLPSNVSGAIKSGGIGSAGTSVSSNTPTIQIKSVAEQSSADLLREAEMVKLISGGSVAPQVNITINGAIDPEGTARAMADLLNYQSARSFAALISQ